MPLDCIWQEHDTQLKSGSLSAVGTLQLVRAETYTRAVFYGCVVLVRACYSSWLQHLGRRLREAEFTYQEPSGNL